MAQEYLTQVAQEYLTQVGLTQMTQVRFNTSGTSFFKYKLQEVIVLRLLCAENLFPYRVH